MREYTIGPDFPVDGSYVFSAMDYIESFVLEAPLMYVMMPNYKMMYIYIMDRGIVRINGNFDKMTKKELEDAVTEIRSVF